MDEYETKVLELAEKLTEKECGNIRSAFGVMDLVYSLAEETTRRVKKKKFSYEFKKILSTKVLEAVVDILYSKNLISQEIYDYFKRSLMLNNITHFIEYLEDINEIWVQNISSHCLFFKKNNNGKLKKLRRLK